MKSSSNIEDRLQETIISVTDVIQYHNRIRYAEEPEYLYPDTMWMGKDVLLVACRNRTYLNIACNVVKAITGLDYNPSNYHGLNASERKALYDKITDGRYKYVK